MQTDDDYYFPNYISDVMSAFSAYPEIQFSVMEAPVVNEKNKKKIIHRALSIWPREGFYQVGEGVKYVAGGGHFVLTACIYRKALKKYFIFDPDFNRLSDLPILISLACKYPFYLSKKIGLLFIRHDSAVGINNSWKDLETIEAILPAKKLIDEKYLNGVITALNQYTNELIFGQILQAIKRFNFSDFLENFRIIKSRGVPKSKIIAAILKKMLISLLKKNYSLLNFS